MPHLFIRILCFCLPAHLSYIQKDSTQIQYDTTELPVRTISESFLEHFREDPKFNYEVLKRDPTWWDNFKAWLGNIFLDFFEWLFGVEKASGFLGNFLDLLPYLLLAILLFLLIKFFLNVNARSLFYDKKNEALVTTLEEEHILRTKDIPQLIQNALSSEDYRLAIRYYYLHILKILSDKELIEWQQQKTNDDYFTEIERPELKQPFGHITRLYDYIWYGSFEIDKAGYKRLEPVFTTFTNKILEHG